jgi:uncharacterized protein YgbK (DUF1537 family)
MVAKQKSICGESLAVGVVADDLTGANDCAVQFVRSGWRTRLSLVSSTPGIVEPRFVLVLVTSSRAQDGEVARASTVAAVTALSEFGIDRLFLKIDSTMRGPIIDQIQGALDAWSVHHADAFAIVCSAYPAMNRTIRDGQVLVNSARVETTSIGRELVTPVATSALSELLPGSVNLAFLPGTAADHARQIESALVDGVRVITVDAVTEDDLQLIGEAVAELGPRAIPVGAAGLALAIARVWADETSENAQPVPSGAPVERVAVVLSSLHDVSRAQCKCLVEALPAERVRVLEPPLKELLASGAIDSWVARELRSAPDLPPVVVITTPTERFELTTGDSRGELAAMTIASGLASIIDAVLDHQRLDAIVLVGGEGALAVLHRLDADGILVSGAIREGIPVGLIEGGKAKGLIVVTKAGGFGNTTSLAEIIPELLNNRTLGEKS